MKNDTRAAIETALGALEDARSALVRSLDQVDRHNIKDGLNRAVNDLKDASSSLDAFVNKKVGMAEELRLARFDIDKAILLLETHRKWFEVWGDSEERR